jgi:Arc/MetJ-type ribon-helix-helix transcriptional regulator
MQSKTHVKDTTPVSTRVTETTANTIVKVLEKEGYLNVSDYLRDLIRKDLENRGLLRVGA